MSSREHAKPPAPISRELQAALERFPRVAIADVVASVAHGAIGQRRADRITPYIDHPRRVATLVLQWNDRRIISLDEEVLQRCVAAALLHDVLEDTKLPRSELHRHIGDKSTLALVDRLTEPPGDPDAPEYFRRIGQDRDARIVKCADRCANLEDVLDDVRRRESLDRWRRYVHKTRRDVLPIMQDRALEGELERRIEGIEALLRTPAM